MSSTDKDKLEQLKIDERYTGFDNAIAYMDKDVELYTLDEIEAANLKFHEASVLENQVIDYEPLKKLIMGLRNGKVIASGNFWFATHHPTLTCNEPSLVSQSPSSPQLVWFRRMLEQQDLVIEEEPADNEPILHSSVIIENIPRNLWDIRNIRKQGLSLYMGWSISGDLLPFPLSEFKGVSFVISNIMVERDSLNRFKHGEQTTPSVEPKKETLTPYERPSLLQMILGMAVEQYQYDPKKKKNEAVSQIHEDIQNTGLSVGKDTIRKYLKEAADKYYQKHFEDE